MSLNKTISFFFLFLLGLLFKTDIKSNNLQSYINDIGRSIFTNQISPNNDTFSGQKLAVLIVEQNNTGIFIYDPELKSLREITLKIDKKLNLQKFSWSPDGEYLVYSYGGTGIDGHQICIVKIDGENDCDYVNGFAPSWSPDGKEIVFINNKNDISILEPFSKKAYPKQILKGVYKTYPEYSPKGDTIAFIGYQDFFHGKLYIADLNSDDVKVIDTKVDLDIFSNISWSPDGAEIAFMSNGDIYTYDLIKGVTINVTDSPEFEIAPSWSPDGNWITYSGISSENDCGDKTCENNYSQNHIYKIKPDGSEKTQLIEILPASWMGFSEWIPSVPVQNNKYYEITVLGDSLNFRDMPSINSTIKSVLRTGEKLKVIEGPIVENKINWWKIELLSSGGFGWIAEAPGWLKLSAIPNK